MFGHQFYHSTIRDYIIVFGTLFNEIYIQRTDSSNNVVDEFKIPLSYGPRDKMLARLDADPDLNRQAAITLPRMAFELVGATYDTTRKLNTLSRRRGDGTAASGVTYSYNPVPYNFQFQLSVAAKNAEDGTKIVEQILPFFTPEWNVTFKHVDGIESTHDVPIVLQSITTEDQYTDNFETRRAIIWNLDFVMKGYLYGPARTGNVVVQAIGSILNFDGEVEVAVSNTNIANVSTITTTPGQLSNGAPISIYGGAGATSGVQATATASISNFSLQNVIITNKGNRYKTATITIDSPAYINATATATISSNTVDDITLTSNNSGYYDVAPTVTIDVPQSSVITAEGNTTISGNNVQIGIVNTGTYYLSNATSTVSVEKYILGFTDEQSKFGNTSYLTGANNNTDYTFLYDDSLNDGNLHAYVYVPAAASLSGDLVFKINNTNNGLANTYWGIAADEHSSNNSLATLTFETSNGTSQSYGDITKDAWHFLSVRYNSGADKFYLYIDGVEQQTNVPSGDQNYIWYDGMDLVNTGNTTGIFVDHVYYSSNTAGSLVGYNPSSPVANTDAPTYGSGTDLIRLVTDMENITETVSQNTVATVTNNRVVSAANAEFNAPVLSANVTITAPTGTANDFQATATSVLTNGIVTSLAITDGGDFYTAAPNVAIAAVNTAVLIQATANASLSGDELYDINISNGGFGYISAPSVTISAPDSTTVSISNIASNSTFGYIQTVS